MSVGEVRARMHASFLSRDKVLPSSRHCDKLHIDVWVGTCTDDGSSVYFPHHQFGTHFFPHTRKPLAYQVLSSSFGSNWALKGACGDILVGTIQTVERASTVEEVYLELIRLPLVWDGTSVGLSTKLAKSALTL